MTGNGRIISRADSGLYVVWLQLETPVRVTVGALGEINFAPGVYGYVGSAQRNRAARLRRHFKEEKPLRWHFDYLRPRGKVRAAACLPGDKAGECRLAARLVERFGGRREPRRFGSSDCRCRGHLIRFVTTPDCVEDPRHLHPQGYLFAR